MSGKNKTGVEKTEFILRKGERIPRKTTSNFSEANSIRHAITRDGIFGTSLNDKNQYGPVSMMILLIIFATFTGLGLKLLGFLLNNS